MTINTSDLQLGDMQKQTRTALLLSFGSIVVLVIGYFIGIATTLGIFLGAIGFQRSRLIKNKLGMIVGIVGTLLNLGLLILAKLR